MILDLHTLLQVNSSIPSPLFFAIIVIYITSLYVISQTVQFYNYCFIDLCFFKEIKRRNDMTVYLYVFIFTYIFEDALYSFLWI